jgi:hypothetical protein
MARRARTTRTPRPDLSAHFRWEIDGHVHGMMGTVRRPARNPQIASIRGEVTDRRIVVTMTDGTVWTWEGGRYAARKVHGCYAPLMPKPIANDEPAPTPPAPEPATPGRPELLGLTYTWKG